MMRLMSLLLLAGCGLAEERYHELRLEEECRIFGPSCAGDYVTFEACLGDAAAASFSYDSERYQSQIARDCIEALRAICPVRGVDYSVPDDCHEVYQKGAEDSGQ